MQEDLNTICEWPIKYKMVFNEDKFEQMKFGHTKDTPITQYKNHQMRKSQAKIQLKIWVS